MKVYRIIIFFLLILLLSIFSVYLNQETGSVIKEEYQKEQATLLRVIDGDTIETSIGRVRLLGINAPEKNMPLSNESIFFLRKFENKTISLLRDYEDTDKYNRKLRYLFYDNRLINLEILEKGFANAYYFTGLVYEKQLLNAESQARKFELGIWEKSTEACSECIELKEFNSEQEFFILRNSCNFNCNLNAWFIKDSGRDKIYLDAIEAQQNKRYVSEDVWDKHDKFFIFDAQGKLVLYYEY